MRFAQTLLGLLSLTSLALSSPVPDPHPVSLSKRYSGTPKGKDGSGGPDVSDYNTDDEIRAAYITPSGPSVFFSQIPSSTLAYNYAQSVNGVIFRGTFPRGFTAQNKRSKEWYQDFADRFSGVYAEKASGEVFLVAPFDAEIAACRVWQRIELPTLRDNAAVTKITLVDHDDFTKTKTLFERGVTRLALRDMDFGSLAKRDDACPDWTDDEDGMDPAEPDVDSDSDSDVEDIFD
ncbi:hypothetical protein BU26DRAFT_600524 [Trematosphaeria pertusa]|uniref:ADP-ribosyl cyclase/cyclic ADP-ribose hydrolase n=1 Tax=Trematosphaeria pertusa TaxID=390896 RepID=A0A6A6IX77_9PLEO|nr:uncharacterized protein BU26DRAFT_600524 [Trematosphaeria pertusa]KAF2254908.1 hypothetical protein BU26DRAFT_600524 [Trematosphaeria pertusa]